MACRLLLLCNRQTAVQFVMRNLVSVTETIIPGRTRRPHFMKRTATHCKDPSPLGTTRPSSATLPLFAFTNDTRFSSSGRWFPIIDARRQRDGRYTQENRNAGALLPSNLKWSSETARLAGRDGFAADPCRHGSRFAQHAGSEPSRKTRAGEKRGSCQGD